MGHPTVEVTLLFTDIEGSTALAHELGDAYVDLLAHHNRIIRDAIGHHVGVEARNEGDAFFAAFDRAEDAVSAALDAQRALAGQDWFHGRPLRVRMGLHTGPVIRLLHDFAGLNVHLASRVASAAHGGQVVASQAVLAALSPVTGLEWIELGAHIVKDFPDPITLYQLAADGLDTKFPPLVTIDARDHNLPAMVTSFVGRADELANLRSLLSGDARLISLTGPGGVGKTRLATEATWSVLSRFRAGAWFVDFASVTDPNATTDTIANALGVRDEPDTSRRDLIADKFASGPGLLVLDNLEQILSGVVAISELLAACPKLVVLATTRERLRLQGEHEVVLDGLADADAVALFTSRAALVQRDFVADEHVAALCQRVGGLPLAIELAAARLRTHTVESLLAAMDSMLDTLTEGERDRPARHQAMRAAIALSVDALTEAERSVFRAFATFAGGATAEAIAGVCIPKADEVQSLVEKSLLQERDGRFVMLEPIRQYAEERLAYDVPGEHDQRVQAHADFFLQLAQRLEPDLVTARQGEALDELTADHANLRLAWERADGDTPLLIAAALTRFWTYRGHPHEGRAVLKRTLSVHPSADPTIRARALVGAGQLALLQSDVEDARVQLEAAVALGDSVTVALGHNLLGEAARSCGDLERAEREFALALATAEAAGDDRVIGLIRNNQSLASFDRNDFEAAAELARKALSLAELTADQQATGRALTNLGRALRSLGRLEEAQGVFERSLTVARQNGNRGEEALALQNVAISMQFALTDVDAETIGPITAVFMEAVEILEELGYKRDLARTLLAAAATIEDLNEQLRVIGRARAIYSELRDSDGLAEADRMRTLVEAGA